MNEHERKMETVSKYAHKTMVKECELKGIKWEISDTDGNTSYTEEAQEMLQDMREGEEEVTDGTEKIHRGWIEALEWMLGVDA